MTYIHVNVYDLRIVEDADYRKDTIECLRRIWEEDLDEDDREQYNNDFSAYVAKEYDSTEGQDTDFVTIDEKYRNIVEDIRSTFGTIDDLRAALPEGEF